MSKKTILITGATGFVGNKLMHSLDGAVASPSLRGATKDDVRRILEESNADIVIHTAAIADMNVCEKNPEASYEANVLLPLYLAEACGNKKMICFSSDQVYSGGLEEHPYNENEATPSNVYGRHKLEMEQRVLEAQPLAVMLRAEWMYDFTSHKGNYFLNMLSAKDEVSFSSLQHRGLTYLKEVADNMEKVIALPGGVYNFGSETSKSMYDISKEFITAIKKDIEVKDSLYKHNLWMDCAKAKQYGISFSETLDGLIQCYNDYISP